MYNFENRGKSNFFGFLIVTIRYDWITLFQHNPYDLKPADLCDLSFGAFHGDI
jgi:hypothetical protein